MITISNVLLDRRRRGILIRDCIRNILAVAVVLGATVWGALWYAFEHYEPTSFVAEVQTTRLRFIASRAAVDNSDTDGGLFAPSGLLNVLIDGCNEVKLLNGDHRVTPCNDAHFRLDGVKLETLLFGPDSQVDLTVDSGTVKVRLTDHPGVQSIRAIFDGAAGEGTQQWIVSPAHSNLSLVLTEQGKTLANDSKIGLAADSTVYLETDDESSLVGDSNKLLIPRLNKNINVRNSRMRLSNLTSANIRRISWNRNSESIISMSAVITGRSDRIQLFSPYSNESSNEALNTFDYYSHGRRGRFLAAVIGSSGLVALASMAVTALGVIVGFGSNVKGFFDAFEKLDRKSH